MENKVYMADWRTFILNERDPGRSEAEKLVHFEQVPFEEAVKSKYVKVALWVTPDMIYF